MITLIAILAGAVVTRFEPSLHDQLTGAAQVVAADIAYARHLAVTNNSSYRITFEPQLDRYYLEHSGANTALNDLPASAFGAPDDPPTRQTTAFEALPLALAPIELLLAAEQSPLDESLVELVAAVEFGPLGETTRTQPTAIWLASGINTARRYMSIHIDSITGLAEIGDFTATAPVLPPSPSQDPAEPAGP